MDDPLTTLRVCDCGTTFHSLSYLPPSVYRLCPDCRHQLGVRNTAKARLTEMTHPKRDPRQPPYEC